MALKAHFLKEGILEFFNDGSSFSGDRKKEWKKAQRSIYAFIIMTCDDRAATTLFFFDVCVWPRDAVSRAWLGSPLLWFPRWRAPCTPGPRQSAWGRLVNQGGLPGRLCWNTC